jgi:hypothetical protein
MTYFTDKIHQDDLDYYELLALDGQQSKALDLFIRDYVMPLSAMYTGFISDQMEKATSVLEKKALDKLQMSISSRTVQFKEASKSIYAKFIKNVYGDAALEALSITSPAVKESIKGMTVDTFNELIDGALSKTAVEVRTAIRELQYDLIKAEREIENAQKTAGTLDQSVSEFKQSIMDNLWKTDRGQEYQAMMEDGNLVRYSNGALMPFDSYNEMATRTTTLNVQREGVQVQEAINQHRLSEYLLIDDRPLKTDKKGGTHPREICQEILNNKWEGVALIAHDQEAADTFGCYTIEEAKDAGAMGPNCRHGIAPLDDDLYTQIDNILYFAENEVM